MTASSNPLDFDFSAGHAMGSRLHFADATMFWSATGGGVRRYLLSKRHWLRLQGWRHTIFAPGTSGPGFLDAGGLPLPGGGGYRLPYSRRRACERLVRLAPDLIEAGDPYRLAWSALDAGQRLGVPVLAFCHSDLVALARQAAGASGPLARAAARAASRYLRHAYRRFDAVLAPSRSMAELLQGLGVARVLQQPLGVDTGVFHPRERDPLWKRELGVDDATRVVLYAGRFAPEKNLERLAEAVRWLGPGHLLVCVGAGPKPPPPGPQLRLLPFQGGNLALARMLASADAFVHAGDQETFGLAALEAMACGTPVVLQRAAGLAELLQEGGGIGVDCRASHVWAEAIAAALAADRAILGGAARACAETHDWAHVMPSLIERYRRLMQGVGAASACGATQPAVLWRQPLGLGGDDAI